jgi:hypothetical protein
MIACRTCWPFYMNHIHRSTTAGQSSVLVVFEIRRNCVMFVGIEMNSSRISCIPGRKVSKNSWTSDVEMWHNNDRQVRNDAPVPKR